MKESALQYSAPVIHNEHRGLIGKCDPERQVVKEASSTVSVLPLLANFSLDCPLPTSHTLDTQFFRKIDRHSHTKNVTHKIFPFENHSLKPRKPKKAIAEPFFSALKLNPQPM